MMGKVIAFLFVAAVSSVMTGCSSTPAEDDPNRVSTIPWNRPEQWESQGPLGGMMNPESSGGRR